MTELEKSFKRFDRANPRVWGLFKRFTFDAIKSGRKRFSTALITERIRWETDVVTSGEDHVKINNNHKAFYARKFMKEFPKYNSVFTTRMQTHKKAAAKKGANKR